MAAIYSRCWRATNASSVSPDRNPASSRACSISARCSELTLVSAGIGRPNKRQRAAYTGPMPSFPVPPGVSTSPNSAWICARSLGNRSARKSASTIAGTRRTNAGIVSFVSMRSIIPCPGCSPSTARPSASPAALDFIPSSNDLSIAYATPPIATPPISIAVPIANRGFSFANCFIAFITFPSF